MGGRHLFCGGLSMERKNMWEHYTKEKEREGKRTGGTGSQIQKMSGSVQDGENV